MSAAGNLTNFARLTSNALTTWSRDWWKQARNNSFLMGFAGTDENAMVQRITELSGPRDGGRAVITLVADSQGDGVVEDNQLEGNEEQLKSYDNVIQLSQWRHAHRSEGELADQRAVVKFRGTARNILSYALSDRLDQLGFLTLSGISYAFQTNGAARVGSQLPMLSFASDVTAPSSKRGFRWVAATNSLAPAATASVVATDTPSWKMLVNMKAQAVNSYVRPIRVDGGIQVYNVFMTPQGIAKLKMDPDFLEAWRHAQIRGSDNPLFKGTPLGGKQGIYIDGMNIMEYRHVYNTTGLASGSKWGASGTVDGQRVLMCGSQALAVADIGMPKWVEKDFDFDNQAGIAVAKIFGLLKPKFYNIYDGSTEDFGVITVDTAI